MKKLVLLLLVFLFICFYFVSSQNNMSLNTPIIKGNPIFLVDSIREMKPGNFGLQDFQVSIYSYDNSNNISEILYVKDYYAFSDINKTYSKDIYKYNSSNQMILDSFFIRDTNKIWNQVNYHVFNYDSHHNILQNKSYGTSINSDSTIYSITYNYNDIDSIGKEWIYFFIRYNNSFSVYDSNIKLFFYDSLYHKVQYEIDTGYEMSEMTGTSIINYFYDINGNLILDEYYHECYTNTDIPGVIDTIRYYGKFVFQYDENQNMIEKDEFQTMLDPFSDYLVNKSVFKYDIYNNLKEKNIYQNNNSDDTLIIVDQFLYYYHQIPTSVKNISINNNFTIFPNPVNDNIQIKFLTVFKPDFSIKIYNEYGIPVYEKCNINNSIIISTNYFPTGIYFCKIYSGNFTETKKFVVIR